MKYYPAGSPPPSTASVILTVTQQSGIMAGTGITAINSLTGSAQTLGVGTSGTDFAVSSVGTAHTLNLPTASATNRGALSSANWTTFNNKYTGLGQFRVAGRWYNNSLFTPAGASFTNQTAIRYVPIIIDQDVTITRMGVNVTAAAPAGSTCRVGIYTNNAATCSPSTLVVDSGTLDIASGGAKPSGTLSAVLTKGLYWFAYVSNASSGSITAIGSNFVIDVKGQANIGGIGFAGLNQTFTYGPLPATAGTVTDVGGTSTVCIFFFY
jgi:hypothetical protein